MSTPLRPHVSRAPRYTFACPVVFRLSGHDDWRDGTLRNISESGLLFEPRGEVGAGAHLEMNILLPEPGTNCIWCTAIVVRGEEGTSTIAARITEYRLERRAP